MMEVFTVGMKRRVEGTQTPLIQQQFERGKQFESYHTALVYIMQ